MSALEEGATPDGCTRQPEHHARKQFAPPAALTLGFMTLSSVQSFEHIEHHDANDSNYSIDANVNFGLKLGPPMAVICPNHPPCADQPISNERPHYSEATTITKRRSGRVLLFQISLTNREGPAPFPSPIPRLTPPITLRILKRFRRGSMDTLTDSIKIPNTAKGDRRI